MVFALYGLEEGRISAGARLYALALLEVLGAECEHRIRLVAAVSLEGDLPLDRDLHPRHADDVVARIAGSIGAAADDCIGVGRRVLAGRDAFAGALVSKLLAYALGRSLEITDEPAVEELKAQFATNQYRLRDLVTEIAASEPFGMK